jgi:hypothetical protein
MAEHLHGWSSPFLGAPWLLIQVPCSTSHSACSSPTRSLPWRPLLPAMAPRKIPQPSPQAAPSLLHGRARLGLHRRWPLGTRDPLPLYPIPSPTPNFISDLWHTAATAMASIFSLRSDAGPKDSSPGLPPCRLHAIRSTYCVATLSLLVVQQHAAPLFSPLAQQPRRLRATRCFVLRSEQHAKMPVGCLLFCAAPISSSFTPVRPRQFLFDFTSTLFSGD